MSAIQEWNQLFDFVNGRTTFGTVGVRDPDNQCEGFDGLGYSGRGNCMSDGHYMCKECSELSPQASCFEEYGRDGRRDRLRLFWARSQ